MYGGILGFARVIPGIANVDKYVRTIKLFCR